MSVLAKRLRAQLLVGRKPEAPLPVVERLLAIQAQDDRGARLAIRARSAGLSAADVDAALTVDRSLVVTWLNRGTLHLVRSEDYPWLQHLTTPQLRTGTARRLSHEGVTPDAAERGVAAMQRALAEGPLDRRLLRERVAAAGVRTQGQAFVHLLALASIRGLIVRGPMLAGRQAFVLVRDWLGEPGRVDRDAALAELARRYLAGHGPATPADLAKWAGLPLRDARAGLQAIASELHEYEGGLVDVQRPATPSQLPVPQLLGSFEPVLLGWTTRDAILGEDAGRVVSGGVFRAFALVRGRAVATWTISRGIVEVEPFRPLNSIERSALETEAADVNRYLSERR
jgi:hypothetical protein